MARTLNQEMIHEKYGEENSSIFERIRTYGCCACGRHYGIHMHHVRTRGAIGKIDKENVVPLCYKCHSEGHTGGWITFQKKWGVDLAELAVIFWAKAKEWYERNEVGRTEVEEFEDRI